MATEQDVDSDEYCRANRILTSQQTFWVIAAVMGIFAGLLMFLASENWSLRNQLDGCKAACGSPSDVVVGRTD